MKMVPGDSTSGVWLDPFLNLSLPSPATSVCFVGDNQHGSNASGGNGNESDSDSSEDLTFRSSRLAATSSNAFKQQQRRNLLKNRLLVSCHKSEDPQLWDCLNQIAVSKIISQRGGAGMAVKRLHDPSFVMYQTRDQMGTVSVHAIDRLGSTSSVLREYETYSATFCQASPCRGDVHLMALPSRQETVVTVMDDRDRVPIFATSPASDQGMVTSLAMSTTGTGRPVLACGMESGSVVFHDFSSGRVVKGECNLTKDPILALDLVPSNAQKQPTTGLRVVAAAGMAGDSLEVAEMPEPEQGRVALIKASIDDHGVGPHQWTIQTRARLSTCRVDTETSAGKPGVGICRFRPGDGRLLAVGGWDNRVRIFERTEGAALAILRGHVGSVNALDWADDAVYSGLLATAGSDDSTISFWHCFGRS
jgi:WD40 repeat protein